MRLKVLHICAVGFTVEKFLVPLIDEMRKEFDVTAVCSNDKHSDSLKARGYRIVNISIERRIRPFRHIISILRLRKFIAREKFHIVHVHTPVASIIGRIAAKLACVPIIIYTAHGFYFHDNMPRYKKRLFEAIERTCGWLSDFVFAQSAEDCNTAITDRIIDKHKIMAIGNGVNIAKFDISRIHCAEVLQGLSNIVHINKNDIIIGIIGRVVREKGYWEWVRAAKIVLEKAKNVKFVAVGETLESDRDGIKVELDNFIQANKLSDRVVFAGYRTDIPEMISIMDIFTLPSYREGMPRALIEAMCMSKPVVATDIRGCREEVVDGHTGYIIPLGDHEILARKLLHLIEHPELRKAMGENGRKRAVAEYDEREVIKKQMTVIASLIKKKLPAL